ncbi:TIR domain-containing protein [Frankia sp. AgW1.1]|nr:TIR domain-containing protein [Frankia sp. AgW1.1]
MGGVDVFVSYTEADEAWAEWIGWQLGESGLRILLRAWDFTAGSREVAELHRAVSTAPRTVAVLSAAYLTSAAGNAEWQAVWEPTGRSLLTVRVEDCPRPGLLGPPVGCLDLFTLDQDAARARLLDAVALGGTASSAWFLGAEEPAGEPPRFPGWSRPWGAEWDKSRSPFPGLAAFDVSRALVFKGRDQETHRLVEQVTALGENTNEVLALVGPSGCGKSSLAAAGLAAALARRPQWLVLPPVVPGGEPSRALADALAGAGGLHGLAWDVRELTGILTEPGAATRLAEELLAAVPAADRLLLVIDQADELLQVNDTARTAFLAAIADLAVGRTRVVVTLRSEYLDRLVGFATAVGLRVRAEFLPPLDRALLPAVIAGPTRLAGLTIDDDLVRRMVFDTVDGQALPLLAYTLQQLDLAARDANSATLSPALYEEVGGVRGALIRQAANALADARAATGHTDAQVLASLLRLVTIDADGQPVRRRVPLDHLPATTRGDLTPFVARRLLVVDTTPDGDVAIDVAHESLLTVWPPLAAAITESAELLRLRGEVESAGDDWIRRGRPTDRLWNLARATATLAALGIDELTSTGRDFLHTSRRHGRQRRRRRVALLSTLLLLATAVGFVAISQRSDARSQRAQTARQRALATAQQLDTRADQQRTDDPETALRLDIAAERLTSTFDTRTNLASALATTPWTATTEEDQNLNGVAFSPDGGTLATIGGTGAQAQLRLYDAADPRVPAASLNDDRPLADVAFSPDGHTVATVSSIEDQVAGRTGGRLRLYDTRDPRRPPASVDDDQLLNGLAFSPDGRILATVSQLDGSQDGGRLRLYDPSDPRVPIASLDDGQVLVGLAFSHDGHTLVTISYDTGDRGGGRLRFYDVSNPHRPTVTASVDVDQTPGRIAASPDGHTLATVGFSGDGGWLRFYDVSDPHHPALTASVDDDQDLDGLAFSPDGRTLATISKVGSASKGRLRFFAVSDPRVPTASVDDDEAVTGLAFSPDGRTLVTTSSDVTGGAGGRLRLYDLAVPRNPTRTAVIDDQPLEGLAYSPDGRTLATINYNASPGMLRLYDVSDPHNPTRIATLDDDQAPTGVAFSPDGHTLALASRIEDETGEHGRLRLYNVRDPRGPTLTASVEDTTLAFDGVAFSPDGRTLAAFSNIGGGRSGGQLRLYDVDDPRVPTASVYDDQPFNDVAFSPDGHLLATITQKGAGRMRLYEVSDRRALTRVASVDDDQPLNGIDFSPAGPILATTSGVATNVRDGGRLRLYDISDPRRPTIVVDVDDDQTLTGVAYSPDGRTVATTSKVASHAGRLRLYDVSDPRDLTRTASVDDDQTLDGLAYSPDGHSVTTVTVGVDASRLGLYEIGGPLTLNGRLNAVACRAAAGGLSVQQWRTEIPSIPYVRTCA